MIAALPFSHPADADPLDGGAEYRIAAHQQTTGACITGWRQRSKCSTDMSRRLHGTHTTLNPMLYAYVSGGTLWRHAHRSMVTSSFTQDPPRTMRMLPVSGPRGSF